MAGYTDTSYRQLVKSLAPSTIVFSEFTSSDALHYKSKKTKMMLEYDPSEQPFIGQIFGKRPENFAEAARFVESIGASGVDINMGCPAKKVVSSDHGSALLEKPKLAEEIVRATVAAVKIPVSVKMRLGVKDAGKVLEFAKMIEGAGAQLLTIHGRTAKQAYAGVVEYTEIYTVKEALKIPVLGNGDIVGAASFREKLGNLDGLMVGRATIGNPWVMQELEAQIQGREYTAPVTLREKLPVIYKHIDLAVQTKGEPRGMMEMRKYLLCYVRGGEGAKEVRRKLCVVESADAAKGLVGEFAEKCGDVVSY